MYPMENLNGPYSSWYDKAHLLKGKTAGWTKEDHEKAGFRMVPNSPVRKGSFVGKNAVLMPCYVCLLYTSPSPRDQRGSRMPSSA